MENENLVQDEALNDVENTLNTQEETNLSYDNEDISEDTTSDELFEISYEQALEWKKKAERLEKAEKKLVELKKQLKSSLKTTNSDEVITKKDLEIERFVIKNPQFEEFRDDLKNYLNKWLWLDEASILLERKIQAKSKTNLNIASSEAETNKKYFTVDELERLPQKEYEKVMSMVEKWQAFIK